MAMPRGAAVPMILHDREWMAGALAKLEAYHKQFPVCIVHGDTHLGNLYIEPDGTPGFLDAQTNRGPWQFEVNYHLIVALDMLDRRQWEKPLLVRYLEALRSHGVDAPSFEEAWEAYRRETAYGYFIFAINENEFQTEAVNTAEAARFACAAIDHDTVRLLS
jgi:aminoglycoside phosphotransferase (APT) family kinase protein